MSNGFYDALEVQEPAERELNLFTTLRSHLRGLVDNVPALQRQLEGVDITSLQEREDLAQIPVVRKYELLAQQTQQRQVATNVTPGDEVNRIFGGFSAVGWGQASRVYASPGPLFEPEVARSDNCRFARAK